MRATWTPPPSPAHEQDFLKSTQATEVAAQLFANYSASVKYNLAAVNKMPPPK